MLAPAATPRATLALALALVLLLYAGCGASDPADRSTPGGDASGVPARQAQSFVQSVGVNTHTYYSDTVYHRRFGAIVRRLRQLGARHVRENLVPHRPDQYRQLNRLATAGIHSQLILGDPRNGLAGLRRLVAILSTRLDGAVDAAEGPNEFDLSGEPDWKPRLARYQRALYAEIRDDPALSSLPVVGPSVGQLEDGLLVPDLSHYLDFGNIHSYPDAEPPEGNVSEWLDAAARMSGSKPVMATETGYHTALNANEGQRPVSEPAMATYVPRTYLDYFARGIARTFPYELVDEFPDPGREEPEWNFGLLRNDLSPKPAFTAMSNLVGLVEDGGPSFDPGRLDYSLGGDTSDLRQLLLQKRDGRFYLALWRDSSVWDANARAPLHPGTAALAIQFATAPKSVRLFLPNRSRQAIQGMPLSAGATSLQVGPRVAVLEIEPG